MIFQLNYLESKPRKVQPNLYHDSPAPQQPSTYLSVRVYKLLMALWSVQYDSLTQFYLIRSPRTYLQNA